MRVRIPLGFGLYGMLTGKPIDIAATMYGAGYSLEQIRKLVSPTITHKQIQDRLILMFKSEMEKGKK